DSELSSDLVRPARTGARTTAERYQLRSRRRGRTTGAGRLRIVKHESAAHGRVREVDRHAFEQQSALSGQKQPQPIEGNDSIARPWPGLHIEFSRQAGAAARSNR